ncbi:MULTISPECIES: hypothetical protein [Mycobacteriaceae]|uniref:hypothetical protein n=1 Tax=Mycobacteriaceae TaxID=1762 RepID=UPI0007FDE15D|nr:MULTISPECIES: hypothetical protein [Mycobacteriaceae]MCK0174153.1 hypothetical protein [Mycolicibacterium sp. F2034L]OBB62015.1 hypothetical protein A5757_05300 [Mycobacterium sp. 852013-51886_SCH5428379]
MPEGDQRQDLQQVAEEAGWRRNDLGRVDLYLRGDTRVRVVWRGSDAISGATLTQDDVMMTYTRDLPTATSWLKR